MHVNEFLRLRRIARAYHAAPVVSADAWCAYATLALYIEDRFNALADAGWTFERDTTGALPDLGLAFATRTLPVYDLHHDHPVMPPALNWKFRAVHDVIGHESSGFGWQGELLAAAAQVADVEAWGRYRGIPEHEVRAACCAVWTEVVGQAACNELDGAFPVQKAALLWSVYSA